MDNKIKRNKNIRRAVRVFRIREKISGTTDRPRLLFTKTLKYLYAQIINDSENKTLFSMTTLNNKDINTKSFKNKDVAVLFGKLVGDKLKENGIEKLVFDRNGYLYHGKVKAFADAVREKGINF
jgi:large subunit ribosomal protein L18